MTMTMKNIHCQSKIDRGIIHTRSWQYHNWQYYNFGKGGRNNYLYAPSSCLQYDSGVCGGWENGVQGARKIEYNLENYKNTYEKTV